MMSPVMFALARVALLASLTACSVGAVDGPPPVDAAPSAAELSFNSMIKPIVVRCVGCHSGGSPPNLSSYSALTANANTRYTSKPGSANVMVTKGDHAGIIYFTPADKATMENWINSLP
jgi:hypothetical protein